MTIFLTGGSGGIGVSLAGLLLDKGHRVIVLTRSPKASELGRKRFLKGDLLQPATYASALGSADAIIHLAALTHSNDSQAYHRVNVEGTNCLLNAAKEEGFSGRFLYASTRAVGDACGGYGASKARAEELVTRSGLSWTILRPAEVYGASGSEAISGLVRSAKSSFLLPLPGRGGARLAPVHVDDIIEAFASALSRDHSIGSIYTLAGPEELTYREIADKVLQFFGRKAFFIPVPLLVFRLGALAFRMLGLEHPPLVADQILRLCCRKDANSESARRDLGFNPRSLVQSLEAGLL